MKTPILGLALTLLVAATAPASAQTIRPSCTDEVFASMNVLDRPVESFVDQIRAAIGKRATRAEAYSIGEAYCRHPQRLKDVSIATRDLIEDIQSMKRRR